MNGTTATAHDVHDYRHWFVKYIRDLVPADFTLIELSRAQTTPRRIITYLLDPAKKAEVLPGYAVEWVDAVMPRYFNCRFEAQWSNDDALERDDQFWQAQDKRVLSGMDMTKTGWKGILKVSRGEEVLYWCEDQCCNGNGWTDLHYVAFKNEAFLEELMLVLIQAEKQHTNKNTQTIYCQNGPDLELEHVALDRVVLPDALKRDVVTCTEAFFKCSTTFSGIGIPSKRGFLLAGSPGNGKTLLCHALANHAAGLFNVSIATLRVNANVDNDDVVLLYEWGAMHAPCMILLEDVETLLTQTQVTRSGFLNVIDGLTPKRGVLTIATTNYPEKLDPALANRPSRFDRVWRIPSPDDKQRRAFLDILFAKTSLEASLYDELVRRTRGWSMAYVQELKATAVVNAMQCERDHLLPEDVHYAMTVLAKQFRGAQKQHQKDNPDDTLGFAA
jgi:AAA+ superfamily predicted ATPase